MKKLIAEFKADVTEYDCWSAIFRPSARHGTLVFHLWLSGFGCFGCCEKKQVSPFPSGCQCFKSDFPFLKQVTRNAPFQCFRQSALQDDNPQVSNSSCHLVVFTNSFTIKTWQTTGECWRDFSERLEPRWPNLFLFKQDAHYPLLFPGALHFLQWRIPVDVLYKSRQTCVIGAAAVR